MYAGLVQAARARTKRSGASAEQAVDLMLAAMEGIKLQALYDSGLCSKESEKAIVDSLKKILGLSRIRA